MNILKTKMFIILIIKKTISDKIKTIIKSMTDAKILLESCLSNFVNFISVILIKLKYN